MPTPAVVAHLGIGPKSRASAPKRSTTGWLIDSRTTKGRESAHLGRPKAYDTRAPGARENA
eukprot:2997202-Prorocentrum_lima.AAC.1